MLSEKVVDIVYAVGLEKPNIGLLDDVVYELTDNLRKNIIIDWSKRESVRASLRLRLMVKRIGGVGLKEAFSVTKIRPYELVKTYASSI